MDNEYRIRAAGIWPVAGRDVFPMCPLAVNLGDDVFRFGVTMSGSPQWGSATSQKPI